MSDQKENVEFVFDANDAERTIESLYQAFYQLNEGMTLLEDPSYRIGASGKLLEATFKAQTDEGKKLTITMAQLTEGALKYSDAMQRFISVNTGKVISGSFAGVMGITGVSGGADPATVEADASKLQASIERRDLELNKLAGQRIASIQARDLEMNQLAGQEFASAEAAAAKKLAIMEKYDLELNKLAGQEIAITQRRDLEMNQLEGVRIAQMQQRDMEMNRIYGQEFTAQEAAAAKQIAIEQKRDLDMNRIAGQEIANMQRRDLEMNRIHGQQFAASQGPDFMDNMLSTAGGMISAQIFMSVTGALTDSIKQAQQFEIEIARIQDISSGAAKTTKQWSDELVNLSNTFGKDIKEVSDGTYEALASHAVDATQAPAFMESAGKFSTVTGASTSDAVKLLTDTMNAYNIKAGESEQVSADFFAMIQKGNINVNELAAGFGNVQALAAKLGIGFKETNSVIAAMTSEGVNTSIAIKLLGNLMNLTLKPSKQMADVFKDLGASSFENLIQIRGFAGALGALNDVAEKKGLTELTTQLGSWRTAQGVSLLTGDGFTKFKNDMGEMSGSVAEFGAKFANIMSTPGKQIEVESQKIKNYFMVEIGETIIKTVASASVAMGGFTNVMAEIVPILEAAAIGLTTYKIAMLASTISVEGMTASVLALDSALLLSPLGWAIAGAAVAGFVAYEILSYKTDEEKFQELQGKKIKSLDDMYEKQKETIHKQSEIAKENMDAQAQQLYEMGSETRQVYDNVAQKVKSSMSGINESLSSSFAEHIELMKNSIKGLEETIKNSMSIIKEDAHIIADLNASEDKRAFNNSIEGLTGPKRDKAIVAHGKDIEAQGLSDLSASAQTTDIEQQNELRRKGLDEIKEARSLFAEAQKDVHEAGKDEVKQKQEVLKIEQEIAKLEESHRYAQQREDQQDLENAQREAENLRKLENTHNKISKKGISNNAYGKASNAYGIQELNMDDKRIRENNAEGHNDTDYARKHKELEDKLVEAQNKTSIDTQIHALDIEKEMLGLKEKELDVLKQNDKIYADRAEKAKKDLEEQKKALDEVKKLSSEIIKFNVDKGDGKAKTFADYQSDQKKLTDLEQKLNEAESKAGGSISLGDHLSIDAKIEEKKHDLKTMGDALFGADAANALDQSVKKNIEGLHQLRDGLAQSLDTVSKKGTDAVKDILDRLEILNQKTVSSYGVFDFDKIKNHNDILDAQKALKAAQTPDQQQAVLDTKIAPLSKTLLNTKYDDNTNVNAGRMQADILDFTKNSSQYEITIKKIAELDAKFPQAVAKVSDVLLKATDVALEECDVLSNKVKAASDVAAAFRLSNMTGADWIQGPPKPDGYAQGGSPYGRDSIHAMLGPDETVMNSAASMRFRSQLHSMNMGMAPRFAQGGSVTNVGDLSVNVQGTGNTETDARQIGHALYRLIKRGQLVGLG